MKTIHDYGQGHQRAAVPTQSPKPDLTEEAYEAEIAQLWAGEDFSQLEKIAQENRREGRLSGGAWKNYIFFQATSTADNFQDSGNELAIARAKKWASVDPHSAAAKISLALLYINYATFARGTGYANTVSDAQWKLFHERLAHAGETLLEASRLKERDPQWYEAMQEVAFYEGWDQGRMVALLNEAVTFEPEYFHYYREYAGYLRPEWYGQRGDIEAFAKDVANRFPEPKGSILYFRIVSSLACYCAPTFDELSSASWPKLKEGYGNLQRLYGTSNLNANRFALMAYRFRDESSAREAFGSIGKMEPNVWMNGQMFQYVRAWAIPFYGLSNGTDLVRR